MKDSKQYFFATKAIDDNERDHKKIMKTIYRISVEV